MELRKMAEYGLADIPEAAAFLRVSRSKVYEMLQRKELRSIWLGKCRRIPRLELINYVEQKLSAHS
ncbi:Helix-turn-helix domain protein [compost metagenome]